MTSCKPGFRLIDNRCVCPKKSYYSGYYAYNEPFPDCQPCHSLCENYCHGPGDNECQLCSLDKIVDYLSDVPKCRCKKFFYLDSRTDICKKCLDKNCEVCDPTNPNVCFTCNSLTILHNGKCVSCGL
jgi:hypothetical protein